MHKTPTKHDVLRCCGTVTVVQSSALTLQSGGQGRDRVRFHPGRASLLEALGAKNRSFTFMLVIQVFNIFVVRSSARYIIRHISLILSKKGLFNLQTIESRMLMITVCKLTVNVL